MPPVPYRPLAPKGRQRPGAAAKAGRVFSYLTWQCRRPGPRHDRLQHAFSHQCNGAGDLRAACGMNRQGNIPFLPCSPPKGVGEARVGCTTVL